jgi:NAD(P)-dependent dehydrogenase (short-subunit alcohol dehydrogenase family)
VRLRADELFGLDGRTAVLTGAAGFLGRTMARTLLENGARVVALGRSERLDEEVAAWTAEFGTARCTAERVDMYDTEALRATLERIAAREERLDVLVNNAHELGPATGFNVPGGTLEEMTKEQWDRHLSGAAWWAAVATQVLGGRMRGSGGSIVNVSSMYGLVAPSPRLYEGTDFVNPVGYSAAKAALLALTRYTASFWGRDGVRANALVPGPFSNVEEEGPNSVGAGDPFLDRLRERTLVGRTGEPRDLAGALLFLACDASSFVTGQSIVVDGGWTVT